MAEDPALRCGRWVDGDRDGDLSETRTALFLELRRTFGRISRDAKDDWIRQEWVEDLYAI